MFDTIVYHFDDQRYSSSTTGACEPHFQPSTSSFRSSVKQVNSPAATKLPRDPPSPRPTLKFAPANVPEGTSEKAPDKVPTNVPEQTPVVNLAGTGGPPVPTLIPNQIMLQNLFHGNQRYSRSTGHCHQPRIVQIPANTTDKYLSSQHNRV
ncbi:hypothetical protein ACGC1H_001934 [Rhizoctonia solani]